MGFAAAKKGDYQQAVRYFAAGAKAGHARSQYNLGACYIDGLGVKKSYSQAAKWYTLSAEQGYDVAQVKLGLCYYRGAGVTENKYEAKRLFKLAADQGNVDAQDLLKELEYELNRPWREAQAARDRMRRTAPELNPDDLEGNNRILKKRVEDAGLRWPGD
jgi:TPR repeat protein